MMVPWERIELLSVLELEPGRYKTAERDFPKESGAENPEGWDRYWHECLADSGVVGIEPLRPGSWLIPTARLTRGPVLSKIVLIESEAWGSLVSAESLDEFGPLCGGFVLKAAGAVVLEPGCCGDLANLADWRKAADQTDEGWSMLWTGHPWPSTRLRDGVLEICRPTEEAPFDVLGAVRPSDLSEAIGAAQREVERFAEHLLDVVRNLLPDREVAGLVRVLSGLARP